MSRTVDKLQKQLQEYVFHYAQDGKKAAGRALGTLVEIVTYYKLCAWGFSRNLLIEKSIPEFGRGDIRHNVEFSLHKVLKETPATLPRDGRTITGRTLSAAIGLNGATRLTEQLLTTKGILRNSAVISEHGEHVVVANLAGISAEMLDVLITEVDLVPAAIIECKRVGVEEGMKKGPQSIEKAKQGAYVAKSVSALQKVVLRSGEVLGFLPQEDGPPLINNYDDVMRDIIDGRIEPQGFVLTVGVVSNHGNWFTSSNMNKELKVLAAAYDWLLFLTDPGLMDVVDNCILNPPPENEPIRDAFRQSYTGQPGGNRFTKTKLDLEADQALRRYFVTHSEESDGWFNVITPSKLTVKDLCNQLTALLPQ